MRERARERCKHAHAITQARNEGWNENEPDKSTAATLRNHLMLLWTGAAPSRVTRCCVIITVTPPEITPVDRTVALMLTVITGVKWGGSIFFKWGVGDVSSVKDPPVCSLFTPHMRWKPSELLPSTFSFLWNFNFKWFAGV